MSQLCGISKKLLNKAKIPLLPWTCPELDADFLTYSMNCFDKNFTSLSLKLVRASLGQPGTSQNESFVNICGCDFSRFNDFLNLFPNNTFYWIFKIIVSSYLIPHLYNWCKVLPTSSLFLMVSLMADLEKWDIKKILVMVWIHPFTPKISSVILLPV